MSLQLIRLYLKLLSLISPKAAAEKVYHFMSNPRIRKLREREEVVLAQARQGTISFRQFELQKYEWGDPNHPTLLLVHGWEGQAGNFASLIDLLLAKNYHLLAFDAPSHGKSSIGDTSMFEFGDFVSDMLGIYRPETVISHSFGSVSTASALRANPDVKVKLWVIITTPFAFRDRVSGVIEQVGLGKKVMNLLLEKVRREQGESIEELRMDHYCAHLDNLASALIIHSQSDRVLPIEDSRKLNRSFSQSHMIELDGLGHYSILWSEELKEIIEKYV